MDRQFLEENNLMEAHKQFMRLCEWDFNNRIEPWENRHEISVSSVGEFGEDEDPEAQGEGMPQDPNQAPMGGDGQQPMNGGQDPMGDEAPMDGGQDPMGGEAPMGDGQDPNQAPMGDDMGMGDPMGGEAPMDGEAPMGDDMGMGEPPMEDEEVIDVEDITKAQEKMNAKINTIGKDYEGVNDNIKALMASMENITARLNQNISDIEEFKKEFQRRNPTETEKLNLRSLDSAPFNEKPTDWWAKENAKGRYNAYADNSELTAEPKYITNSDVDNFDERKIADSFFIDDDMIQNIEKIFGI